MTGTLYAYVVCGACEDDSFGCKINNVLVSDFVYPAWFENFREESSTQFDRRNQIKDPWP
jgi:transcription elongation factor Elf1